MFTSNNNTDFSFKATAAELCRKTGKAADYIYQRSKSLWYGAGFAAVAGAGMFLSGQSLTSGNSLGIMGVVMGIMTSAAAGMNVVYSNLEDDDEFNIKPTQENYRMESRTSFIWGSVGLLIVASSTVLLLHADKNWNAKMHDVIARNVCGCAIGNSSAVRPVVVGNNKVAPHP